MNQTIHIGRKYRNKHTGRVSTVTQKIFFNIQHYDDEDLSRGTPQYTHYRTFAKHWEPIDEVI